MTYRKKLIEVALPLEAINVASAREKSIRHGHPSTLHLWWARRPLAACQAVLFASLVDDPSSLPEQFPTEEAQEQERQRLFRIIEELVKWENSTNERVLEAARAEIMRSTNGNPPPVLDPFAGGGSIPLEAQRLGLEAHASDLNPVAVLINKALIEIPPKFAGMPPINPEARAKMGHGGTWKGAQGLAEDVRYYGKWMRDEAFKRIGHLYPKVTLPKEHGGGEATVIAWSWARTVKCPNPACGTQMPLVRSFSLAAQKSKQIWVEPTVDRTTKTVNFEIRAGLGTIPTGTVNRRGARCVVCGAAVPFEHIRTEGKAGGMDAQLMAVVVEGQSARIYLQPTKEDVTVAQKAIPTWKPDANLPHNPRDFKTPNYGMSTFADLFTPRQIVAMTTLNDLVAEVRDNIVDDARTSRVPTDISFTDGGYRAEAYADAVVTYLAEAVSKLTTFHNTLAYWRSKENKSATGFGRQALAMTWDYTEANPFAGAGGDFLEIVTKALPLVLGNLPAFPPGSVMQCDAAALHSETTWPVISTDPPYYDNIGYADLSDFFYVWLRRSLSQVYPNLFSTVLVPKAQELVATPYRFGGNKEQAQQFFEGGLRKTFAGLQKIQHPDYPLTVYYAFKQAEEDEEGETSDGTVVAASTGWETMLEGLLGAQFLITGTWPMRTENTTRILATGSGGTNALASSIVLVCRSRPENASMATRCPTGQSS